MTEEQEQARPFTVSLYPRQILYIKARAAREFRHNISAAAQAVVDADIERHPEVNLEDGDWTGRRTL